MFLITLPSTKTEVPLCPLFDIVIEPLAIAIRNAAGFKWCQYSRHTHMSYLYMDDLIFYLYNLAISSPKALDIITISGKIPGYKMNLSKSILFPVKIQGNLVDFDQFPFKIACNTFTNLGV